MKDEFLRIYSTQSDGLSKYIERDMQTLLKLLLRYAEITGQDICGSLNLAVEPKGLNILLHHIKDDMQREAVWNLARAILMKTYEPRFYRIYNDKSVEVYRLLRIERMITIDGKLQYCELRVFPSIWQLKNGKNKLPQTDIVTIKHHLLIAKIIYTKNEGKSKKTKRQSGRSSLR